MSLFFTLKRATIGPLFFVSRPTRHSFCSYVSRHIPVALHIRLIFHFPGAIRFHILL
jgi:hypothetical protein